MNRIILLILTLIFSQSLIAQDASAILKNAEEKVRGNSLYSEVTIDVIRPTWKRSMAMKAWSKGTDYSLVLITSPAHDKGTVFLKRNREIWNWLPTIQRTIKLPPSMMQQSWMGTDFTNDDLVRADSYVKDYNATVIGDSVIQNKDCYKLQLLPKPNAGVVWGKVIIFISKKDYWELRLEFYDEDGYLVNVMTASDPKELGGRMLPSKLVMVPEDKPGHETIMNYKKLVFDRPIDESFFTKQNMQRVR